MREPSPDIRVADRPLGLPHDHEVAAGAEAFDVKRYFWDDASDTITERATDPETPGAPGSCSSSPGAANVG